MIGQVPSNGKTPFRQIRSNRRPFLEKITLYAFFLV